MSIRVNDEMDPDLNFFGDVNCKYYDHNSFNSTIKSDSSQLVVIHQNIRSFSRNFDEFVVFYVA